MDLINIWVFYCHFFYSMDRLRQPRSWSSGKIFFYTQKYHFQLNPEPLNSKMAALAQESIWFNKSQCDDAERMYFEKLSGAKVNFACFFLKFLLY